MYWSVLLIQGDMAVISIFKIDSMIEFLSIFREIAIG